MNKYDFLKNIYKKTLIAFCIFPILFSCGNKWSKYISRDELQELIEELYTMKNSVRNSHIHINDTVFIAWENQIFNKYNIDRTTFDSILHYYNREKTREYIVILERTQKKVNAKLRAIEEENQWIDNNTIFQKPLSGEISDLNKLFSLHLKKRFKLRPFRNNPNTLLFSANIENDTIPEGTQIILKSKILGLPINLLKDSLNIPRIYFGYTSQDYSYINNQITFLKNGWNKTTITFDKAVAKGHLTIQLLTDLNKGTIPFNLLIEDITLDIIE